MTKKERIFAAIQGEEADRIPFALWRHFPNKEETSRGIAGAILGFQKKFNTDLLKVTPASGYFAEAFGCQFLRRDDKEGEQKGTRKCVSSIIQNPAGWGALTVLNQNILDREIEAIKIIKKELSSDTPIIQTIPNPITIAKTINDACFLEDLRNNSQQLKKGLEIITQILIKFSQDNIKAGADGIFFFTQLANHDILKEEEYKEFGVKYDLIVLNELSKISDLLILHLHGAPIMFNLLKDYPVQAVNWHDRRIKPSLAEAQQIFKGAVLGGIDEWDMLLKKPEEIKEQVKDAIRQTNGKRLIIGPGCTIPLNAPEENLKAIQEALTGF